MTTAVAQLAFTRGPTTPTTPHTSAIASALPHNLKLQTVTCNYARWNDNQCILRLAHLYQVDEHPVLSQPANVSLAAVFSKAGLTVTSATETMLTANQPRAIFEAKKLVWNTSEVVDRGTSTSAQVGERAFLDSTDKTLTVTLNAMEVKTFLVRFA